tara:strand:- start:447 stop:1574 length:1128 start_codon:yes stop_codon:yes gene_type:complete
MTITNSYLANIGYVVNASTVGQTNWDFLFEIQEEIDIEVNLNGTILTLNTDYTVFIDGTSGGTVTLLATVTDQLVVGATLYLTRDLPATRVTSYASARKFDPQTVDDDMNRLTLLSGQVQSTQDTLGMNFPQDYDYINVSQFSKLPATWPDGYALVQTAGKLGVAAIQSNSGDPLLRSQLSVETPGQEGAKLIGTTGQNVQEKLESLPTIDDLANENRNTAPTGSDLIGYSNSSNLNQSTVTNALENRPTNSQLASIDGAGSIGTTQGITVQESLNVIKARVRTTELNRNGGNGEISIAQDTNIISVTRDSPGSYTVTLARNVNTNSIYLVNGVNSPRNLTLDTITSNVLTVVSRINETGVETDSMFALEIRDYS